MLDNKLRKHLQRLAQSRKTIVWISQNGLTGNVLREIDEALNHHELIKVRIRAGDRDSRDLLVEEISRSCGAEPIQRIGNVVAFYRPRPDQPVIRLP